jgi:hypothetical protein
MPHTPPHRTNPPPRTGLAPVPVALLLPPPGGRTSPSRRRGLSRHAACQLLAWYTTAGDQIADLDQHPTITAAAGWLDRRLTTTHPARATGTADNLPPDERAKLVIATLPRPGANRLPTITDWIGQIRARLLADDGYLLTVITTGPAGGQFTDHATTVVAAARSAGLIYHQQLIDIPHPLLPEHEPRAEPSTSITGPPPLHHGRHRPTHTEIYVFAAAGGHRA